MENKFTKQAKTIAPILIHLTWGQPQTLIGLIVFLFIKTIKHKSSPRTIYHNGAIITELKGHWGGITLGMFVFVDRMSEGDKAYSDEIVLHEYGHTLQSLALGPLWSFVIGLPSLIWAGFFGKWREKHNKSYYWFYPEAWANKWGGVKIDQNNNT